MVHKFECFFRAKFTSTQLLNEPSAPGWLADSVDTQACD